MKRLLIATALVAAGCATVPAGHLQPADFAYGRTIAVPSGAPFVRVALPDDAFTSTAWPDLRDVRVFNAAAEEVPFARITPEPTTTAAKRIALRSFRLAQANPGGVPRIELDAGTNSVQMHISPGAATENRNEYMLAASEDDAQARLERLHFSWTAAAQSWQQKVTVSVSHDLQSWVTVAYKRPILDLRTPDGERLKHDYIALDNVGYTGRYWRLQFEPGFSPALTGVQGEPAPEVRPAPGVVFDTQAEPQADGSVVYRLNGMHPITRLRVTPAEVNSVLPIRVEGRRIDTDKWGFITTAVSYRINGDAGEQFSEWVPIDGRSYSAFRVRPFGTTFGATAPTLVAERDALELVINTRGTAPFLLAWGSRAAADTAVDTSILVPGGREAIAKVPQAELTGRQDLGGPDRLTALAPSERAARWQTALVWVTLVGGAFSLAFLALRLLRETRTPA